MREARERGGAVANGETSFLTAQAAAFRLWTGADAPAELLREALAGALADPALDRSVVGD